MAYISDMFILLFILCVFLIVEFAYLCKVKWRYYTMIEGLVCLFGQRG